jgi:hypothetical protein
MNKISHLQAKKASEKNLIRISLALVFTFQHVILCDYVFLLDTGTAKFFNMQIKFKI